MMYSDDLLNGMTVLTAEEYVLGGDVPIKYVIRLKWVLPWKKIRLKMTLIRTTPAN